jgi:hypothetical protein
VTDAQRDRLVDALDNLRQTDWDYYDGDSVWCRFCRATRPSPDHENDPTWHDAMCIWRVANDLHAEGAFKPLITWHDNTPKPEDAIPIVSVDGRMYRKCALCGEVRKRQSVQCTCGVPYEYAPYPCPMHQRDEHDAYHLKKQQALEQSLWDINGKNLGYEREVDRELFPGDVAASTVPLPYVPPVKRADVVDGIRIIDVDD